MNESYKAAGVDVHAGYESVKLMQSHVARTLCGISGKTSLDGSDSVLGGFGGLFVPDLAGIKEPVLISSTDGVGTKLQLASILDRHDTVGIDLVAMCVNDIICCGAKPLFFLDYINCEKNIPEKIASIVKGIADGCVEAGCALIGGETAEHPDFSKKESNEYHYDLAGFCVGIADKSELIGKSAKEGDVLIGLSSSGVHSNGFSLIRKVFDIGKSEKSEQNEKLLETLLTPTKIYVKPILSLIKQVKIKGIANITGGGFYENIPRCIPDGLTAEINREFLKVPDIFELIAKTGDIPEKDMYNTFNMGVGMVAVADFDDTGRVIEILHQNGVESFPIGKIIKGEEIKFV
ncbi:MAG: phosphoribosylformylglycinamidine cyclo-ligase [Oscillospiraceae bacterium]|nr:phosphoribosylformylglycinamidine cyclo-ligase [Oscillospiraceae bacterium]